MGRRGTSILPIINFNGGEWSPKMETRVDHEKYNSAARTMQNFIPNPQGQMQRRSGFQYIASTKDQTSGNNVNIIPFEYDNDTNYIIEVGDEYMRFYTDDAAVGIGSPSAWANATSYREGETVSDGGSNYVCLVTHISKEASVAWDNAETNYVNGDVVIHNSVEYVCLEDHDASVETTDEPAVGSAWRDFWAVAVSNQPDGGTASTTYWYEVTTTAFEIPTPYDEDDVMNLQYAQINDLLYIVHPSYPVKILKRYATDEWALADPNWELPPMLDENTEKDYKISLTAENEWVTATAYYIGDVVLSLDASSYSAWAKGNTYSVGSKVTHGGKYYVAHLAHLSTDSNEAGAGTYSTWFWTETIPTEQQSYVCTQDHTSGASSEPSAGGSWEDYWTTATAAGTTLPMKAYGHEPFTANHVGSYWRIGINRGTAAMVDHSTAADYNSDTILIDGTYTISTTGKWVADITVQESYDHGGTWEDVITLSSTDAGTDNHRNFNQEFTTRAPALVRLSIDWISGTTLTYRIEPVDYVYYGLVKVTGYTSSTEVEVEVVKELLSTGRTDLWSEGAFSDERGYPAAVTLFDERLLYGGTTHSPQDFWGSVIDQYENFTLGSEDTDAYRYRLASTARSPIKWMLAQEALYIGTTKGEYVAEGSDLEKKITPTNIVVRRRSNIGSDSGNAIMVNSTPMWVQRGGKKLRRMQLQDTREFYAEDLTVLAEHIAGYGGMTNIAYQRSDNTTVWTTTATGELAVLTYERNHDVYAWHRHNTDSEVGNTTSVYESLATLPTGEDDSVYVVVKRAHGGTTVRTLEKLHALYAPVDAFLVQSLDAFTPRFADSWVSQGDLGTPTTWTGLDHLEGAVVVVLGDGTTEETATVSSGSITLTGAYTQVVIGLPYEHHYKGMPLDVDGAAGILAGQKKHAWQTVVRLENSKQLDIGNGQNSQDMFDGTIPAEDFTGRKQAIMNQTAQYDPTIEIKGESPLPLTVSSLIIKYNTTSKQ